MYSICWGSFFAASLTSPCRSFWGSRSRTRTPVVCITIMAHAVFIEVVWHGELENFVNICNHFIWKALYIITIICPCHGTYINISTIWSLRSKIISAEYYTMDLIWSVGSQAKFPVFPRFIPYLFKKKILIPSIYFLILYFVFISGMLFELNNSNLLDPIFKSLYWVTQKLLQICTLILHICIGKVAWFAVYICGNFWVTQ